MEMGNLRPIENKFPKVTKLESGFKHGQSDSRLHACYELNCASPKDMLKS